MGLNSRYQIQLEYDLHSGKFLNFQVGPGKNNDKTFGTECLDTLQTGELCIRDLGCFSLEDLDQMDQRGKYYISRLNLNTNVYVKNPNPEYFKNGTIKKQSEHIQIDVKQIWKQLQPGETFEFIQHRFTKPAKRVIKKLCDDKIRIR